MGKSTINGQFSIAIGVYQRVKHKYIHQTTGFFPLTSLSQIPVIHELHEFFLAKALAFHIAIWKIHMFRG